MQRSARVAALHLRGLGASGLDLVTRLLSSLVQNGAARLPLKKIDVRTHLTYAHTSASLSNLDTPPGLWSLAAASQLAGESAAAPTLPLARVLVSYASHRTC